MFDPRASAALRACLRERLADPSLDIVDQQRLSGGAIQQNVALTLSRNEGGRDESLVLRTDAASGVSVSHSREHEYALLVAAFEAGVTVPEPLLCCTDVSVIGAPFFLMRRVSGQSNPVRLTREGGPDAVARERLVTALGEELARIHAVPLDQPRLDFLSRADGHACDGDVLAERVARFRRWLDELGARRPVLEWALAWLARQRPVTGARCLCHNDFRTGNLMIEGDRVCGVLDWEFAAPGDRHEDIGWFCAPCWRFAAREREAGGLGSRAAFYAGYERVSGVRIDRARVPLWEIVATIRWAIIALQQGARFTSGSEPTLELGLTGRMLAALERDLLGQVRRAAGEAAVPVGACPEDRTAHSPVPAPVPALVAVDAPGGAALLGAARATLLDTLLPRLPPECRYPALMVGNAMGIAARELDAASVAAGVRVSMPDVDVTRRWCEAARTDEQLDLFDPRLLARLDADVARRLAIDEPGRGSGV